MTVSATQFSRRAIMAGAMTLGVPAQLFARPRFRLIAGNYAQEGGPGLVPLEADVDSWTAGQALGNIRNASFGVQSAAHGLRYLVNEQAKGALAVYDRGFRRIALVPTLGADPCHVALSADGRALAVANYSSGTVALWRLDRKTGLPMGEAQRIDHTGSGPDAKRQAGPHAHWVGFAANGRLLHSVDLGADAIFSHALDARTGAFRSTSIAYRAEAGSGPRHMVRHPAMPVAYVVAELANSVTTLRANPDGSFTRRGTRSTLPAGFAGSSAAAHIAINRSGTRLYVSNRGHDSIAVFAIDRQGEPSLIQHAGCGGHWPRLFLLLEDNGEMLVCNQRSGSIARLRIGADGRLGAANAGPSIPGVAFVSA